MELTQVAGMIPPTSAGAADLAAPSVVVSEVGDMDSLPNDTPSLPPPTPSLTPGQTDTHLPSQSRSAQDPTLAQPAVTMALPEVSTPILAPAESPLQDPLVDRVPSMTGTTVMTPPAPVLAPAEPPLQDSWVDPVLSMTGTTVTTPPAPILAPAVPPLKDLSVAPGPSVMSGTTATSPVVSSNTLGQPPAASNPVPSAGENEQRATKKGKMHPGPSLTARYGILTHGRLYTHTDLTV